MKRILIIGVMLVGVAGITVASDGAVTGASPYYPWGFKPSGPHYAEYALKPKEAWLALDQWQMKNRQDWRASAFNSSNNRLRKNRLAEERLLNSDYLVRREAAQVALQRWVRGYYDRNLRPDWLPLSVVSTERSLITAAMENYLNTQII